MNATKVRKLNACLTKIEEFRKELLTLSEPVFTACVANLFRAYPTLRNFSWNQEHIGDHAVEWIRTKGQIKITNIGINDKYETQWFQSNNLNIVVNRDKIQFVKENYKVHNFEFYNFTEEEKLALKTFHQYTTIAKYIKKTLTPFNSLEYGSYLKFRFSTYRVECDTNLKFDIHYHQQ